jgi:hypothetical protein
MGWWAPFLALLLACSPLGASSTFVGPPPPKAAMHHLSRVMQGPTLSAIRPASLRAPLPYNANGASRPLLAQQPLVESPCRSCCIPVCACGRRCKLRPTCISVRTRRHACEAIKVPTKWCAGWPTTPLNTTRPCISHQPYHPKSRTPAIAASPAHAFAAAPAALQPPRARQLPGQ